MAAVRPPLSRWLPTLLPLVLALGLAQGAAADMGPEGKPKPQTDAAATPLWEVGVVAASLSTPAYPASDQRSGRSLALPYLIYRGEVLRAGRSGIGARWAHTEDVEWDIGFSGALPASSGDVALRRGMPDLGTLVEFGPRLKMVLARPTPQSLVRLELPVRAVIEVNGGTRQVGTSFEPKLAWESQVGTWRTKAALSLVVGDTELAQYFYGVAPTYATPVRPAYEARSGLVSSRITGDASRKLNPTVSVFGYARYDQHQGAANAASPLFASSTGITLGVGLAWTLWSKGRGADEGD